MEIRTELVIDVADWDAIVIETYGRPYNYQQQDGCQPRGTFRLTVPAPDDEQWADSVPEIVNGNERGVNFAAWLARDRHQPLPEERTKFSLDLWWYRNFYPPIQSVANDLHAKGLLPAGEYTIDIDW